MSPQNPVGAADRARYDLPADSEWTSRSGRDRRRTARAAARAENRANPKATSRRIDKGAQVSVFETPQQRRNRHFHAITEFLTTKAAA